MKFESRSSRRLRLKRPATAMTGFGRAEIVDLAPLSLGLNFESPHERGATTWVEFTWLGTMIRLDCEVRSCRPLPGENKYRAGLTVRSGFSADEFKQRVEAEIAKMETAEAKRSPVI